MKVIRKSVSIPEELYREVIKLESSFSKAVKEALGEYVKKRKKEKIMSLAGKLELEEDGAKIVKKLREEDIEAQKKREIHY